MLYRSVNHYILVNPSMFSLCSPTVHVLLTRAPSRVVRAGARASFHASGSRRPSAPALARLISWALILPYFRLILATIVWETSGSSLVSLRGHLTRAGLSLGYAAVKRLRGRISKLASVALAFATLGRWNRMLGSAQTFPLCRGSVRYISRLGSEVI